MKATRINAKQAQGLINNEEERFNDQPAIINNGDSKATSISYEGKTIKIKCLLSNTKACKWDKKYPENHNHYIITVSYEGKKLSFDWFDSFRNFRCGVTDKDRNEIVEMFYSFLQDILYKNDFCKEEGNVPILWSALCKHENKYNRVFEGVDIYELANNLRETFDF